MVPHDVALAVVDDEVASASAWAEAHGWTLTLIRDRLELHAARSHPADGAPLLLQAVCDGYRALPPAWRFVDPDTLVPTPHATPTAGSVNGRSSVLHSVGVICAHFSRTAYKQFHDAGPHNNWGELSTWDCVTEGVLAHTIGEMLAVIDQHLRYSPGRHA